MEQEKSLSLLKSDLGRRFASPVGSVTFYSHLFLAIVGGGGLGIWYSLFVCYSSKKWEMAHIAEALFTYFPAIVATAVIELTQEKQPYLRSFGLLSAGLFVILFLLSVNAASLSQLIIAAVSSVLAVGLWWATVGEHDCFKDIDMPSLGPSTDQALLKNEEESAKWK